MKKTARLVLLFLLVSIFTTTFAHAESNTMRFAQIRKDIPEEFVYLQLKPQADAEVLFGYRKGAFLMILDEENGWYHVSIGNQQGYMKTEKITLADSFSSTASLPVALANPTNPTTGWVNLRVEPSQESEGLVRATNGQEIIIIGENDDWAHVIFDGKLGFMMKEFLKMTGSMTVYEAKSIGFSLYTGQAAPPTSEKKPTIGTTSSASRTNVAYSMRAYTEGPTARSSVRIQYPYFDGNSSLNDMIYCKVQNIVSEIYGRYGHDGDEGLTVDYQAAVTLNNKKMVSIIFWGQNEMESSMHESTDLVTLNIDLRTMQEITLSQMFKTDADFQEVFLNKCYYPSSPVTFDKTLFADMLALQKTNRPFNMPGNVQCFLKPDGIVLTMEGSWAYGSDHFEAQLNYKDIEQFYQSAVKYWEN